MELEFVPLPTPPPNTHLASLLTLDKTSFVLTLPKYLQPPPEPSVSAPARKLTTPLLSTSKMPLHLLRRARSLASPSPAPPPAGIAGLGLSEGQERDIIVKVFMSSPMGMIEDLCGIKVQAERQFEFDARQMIEDEESSDGTTLGNELVK